MTEWTEQANGNARWITDKIKCTVFLKPGTKSSWSWVVNHNNSTHYSEYTHRSKAKAKNDIGQSLNLLEANVCWKDVRN